MTEGNMLIYILSNLNTDGFMKYYGARYLTDKGKKFEEIKKILNQNRPMALSSEDILICMLLHFENIGMLEDQKSSFINKGGLK